MDQDWEEYLLLTIWIMQTGDKIRLFSQQWSAVAEMPSCFNNSSAQGLQFAVLYPLT